MLLAALALGCSDANAQSRARAHAEASITLIEPAGLRAAEPFRVDARSGASQAVVTVAEPTGASYQLVTPERTSAGGLVIVTSEMLRGGEGETRLPIDATVQFSSASTRGEHLALLPVTAVFD